MKRSFSFIEKPVLFILKILPALMPGIVKVIAVYGTPGNDSLESMILKKDHGDYLQEPFHVSDANSLLHRFRVDNSPYSWLRIEDLPFEISSKEKVQLNIFNEFNNNILLIRIKNNFDNLNDLFFFYFNPDLSNFGTVNPEKILSTDNKTIIAHLVRNSIITQLDIQKEDRDLFATVTENTRSILNEVRETRERLSILDEKLKDGIIHLVNCYLSEISGRNLREYQLSESAVQKIRGYEGSFEEVKVILERAASYADAMVQANEASTVLISDFHIFFEVGQQTDATENLPEKFEVNVKYEKTMILLNRLEYAANQLKAQNKLLTSSNLGKACKKPMSPPAITDALKKHKSKIFYLFKEYPNRWPLIRNEFRPIHNILNTKPLLEKLTA